MFEDSTFGIHWQNQDPQPPLDVRRVHLQRIDSRQPDPFSLVYPGALPQHIVTSLLVAPEVPKPDSPPKPVFTFNQPNCTITLSSTRADSPRRR